MRALRPNTAEARLHNALAAHAAALAAEKLKLAQERPPRGFEGVERTRKLRCHHAPSPHAVCAGGAAQQDVRIECGRRAV